MEVSSLLRVLARFTVSLQAGNGRGGHGGRRVSRCWWEKIVGGLGGWTHTLKRTQKQTHK